MYLKSMKNGQSKRRLFHEIQIAFDRRCAHYDGGGGAFLTLMKDLQHGMKIMYMRRQGLANL